MIDQGFFALSFALNAPLNMPSDWPCHHVGSNIVIVSHGSLSTRTSRLLSSLKTSG